MTNTGKDISWSNPATGDHNVNVEVLDGKGGSARKDYILKVINKFDDISGRVNDILNGNSVQGADVILGHRDNGNFVADYTVRTDSQGNYVHQRIPTSRNWLVKIVHTNYNTHLAGSIQTTKDENNVDLELIPTSFNMDFFDDIMRDGINNPTKRWKNNQPRIYLDKDGLVRNQSGVLLGQPATNQQQVNRMAEIIKSELPQIINSYFQNLQPEIGTGPIPTLQDPDTIIVYWNDTRSDTEAGAYTNNDEITSAYIRIRNDSNDRKMRHESFHVTGAFGHSNKELSILNATNLSPIRNPLPTDYTQPDKDAGKILYKRPPGNKSINGIPDANLDDYRIR